MNVHLSRVVRRGALLLQLHAVLGMASSASASEGGPKASSELFDAGLEQLKQGRYEGACRLLEDSYELDPLAGTLFTLAECEARRGRIETALMRFRQFEMLVAELPEAERRQQERRIEATQSRKAELEPRRSFLDLHLIGTIDNSVSILVDETEIAANSLAQPLPLDAGMHSVVVLREKSSNKAQVELHEGESAKLELAIPSESLTPPTAAPPGEVAAPKPKVIEPTITAEPTTLPPHVMSSPWKYPSLGLGLVGLGLASVSTVVLLERKPVLDENCPNLLCENPAGWNAARDLGTWDALGTAGAVGAGLGLGLFTYILLTEPNAPSAPVVRVTSTPSGPQLNVKGNF